MSLAIGQLWENALVHCHLPSYVGSRESSRPFFVGPSPSLPRRRQYMRNYFWWAMDITEAWEKANRPIAEALVCQYYADTGDDEVESAFQEYMEDSFLWDMAFVSVLPEKPPPFPWAEPRNSLAGLWTRKDQKAGHKILQHEGILYIDSPKAASLTSRQALYNLFCVKGGGGPNPFELELPDYFNFQELVWGEDGADWLLIQSDLAPSNARLTWGYQGGIPKKATLFEGEPDKASMANVGYMLTVGPITEDDEDEDGAVFRTWNIILSWWYCCRKCDPKPLKVVFYEHMIHPYRTPAEVPGPLGLDYKLRQNRAIQERKACITEIDEILNRDDEKLDEDLERWLMSSRAAVYFSLYDRIDMVMFQWYRKSKSKKEYHQNEGWRLAMLDKYTDFV